MDLRFAAEEGDWGDDDAEVEEVKAEGEAAEVAEVETRAVQKESSATRTRSGKTAKDASHPKASIHVPARPTTRPPSKIHMDPHTRYFVIKSSSHKNIVLSIEHRVWATPRSNQEKLNDAFRSASHVILVFSVTGSGSFQGYAKMLGPVGSSSTDVFQGFGRAFEVRWLRLDDLDFEQVSNIRNPWNENKSVKVSRDGQELPNDVGRQLCDTIDAKVYEGDPSGYIDDSQELEPVILYFVPHPEATCSPCVHSILRKVPRPCSPWPCSPWRCRQCIGFRMPCTCHKRCHTRCPCQWIHGPHQALSGLGRGLTQNLAAGSDVGQVKTLLRPTTGKAERPSWCPLPRRQRRRRRLPRRRGWEPRRGENCCEGAMCWCLTVAYGF